MKNIIFLIIVCLSVSCDVKKAAFNLTNEELLSHEKEVMDHQKNLQEKYANPITSPLKEQATSFKGHTFFPIDIKYRVEANFIKLEKEPFFEIQTSGPKTPAYRKFGLLQFQIAGKRFELTVLQNRDNMRNPLYRNHLFLAFNDLTNGTSTYGGGRYIDLTIPTSDKIIIDFNKSYNPYCAYTTGYSCPIPPEENFMELAVEAGIMLVDSK